MLPSGEDPHEDSQGVRTEIFKNGRQGGVWVRVCRGQEIHMQGIQFQVS